MAEKNAELDLDMEAAEGEPEAPKAPRPWLKYALYGVAAAAVLGLIGGATWYVASALSGGPDTAEEAAAGQPEPAADAKEAPPPPPDAPLVYQSLNPPFVVNFGLDADQRLLQVALEVSARDPAVLEKVKAHGPAIRNNLVLLFSAQDPYELNTLEGKEALRERVLKEIRKVLKQETGAAGVENVYFTSFVMQ